MLKLRNVSKNVKNGNMEMLVLNDIELEIKKGEMVGICGHSGSGKSTLLGIMAGIDKPTEGNVFVEDVDIYNLKEDKLARFRNERYGIIFQNFHLIPNLSVKENVEIPCFLSGKKYDKKELMKLLKSVGLEDMVNSKISVLSGGEKQRVAIARALIQKPEYIFADEPTGSLDYKNRNIILNIFKNIQVKKGISVVLVTHDKEVAEMADRVIQLKYGKIIN